MKDLITPALLLDEAVMQANIERMQNRFAGLPLTVRPHVKTAKCLPIVERMVAGGSAPRLAVSTLREAAEVLAAGYKDVLYAVGVVPQKLARLEALARAQSARVTVLLDSCAMAQALLEATPSGALDAFIELDVDDHRAGVAPDSHELIAIAKILSGGDTVASRARTVAQAVDRDGTSRLRGVMTHAGGAYDCRSHDALIAMAERERAGAVLAAARLRAAGYPCTEVSVGSTPTAHAAASFEGVTEVRVGVYVFNDLVMAGLGVCSREQIAISVLSSVIGHQPGRNMLLIDAGWMALSSDRSTSGHALDQGLGVVVPTIDVPTIDVPATQDPTKKGVETDELIVTAANQEHGMVVPRSGKPIDFSRYRVGSQVRILPIHACSTAAQFAGYHRVAPLDLESATRSDSKPDGRGYWPRFRGWDA